MEVKKAGGTILIRGLRIEITPPTPQGFGLEQLVVLQGEEPETLITKLQEAMTGTDERFYMDVDSNAEEFNIEIKDRLDDNSTLGIFKNITQAEKICEYLNQTPETPGETIEDGLNETE